MDPGSDRSETRARQVRVGLRRAISDAGFNIKKQKPTVPPEEPQTNGFHGESLEALAGIVGRFFCDDYVMWVAFLEPCRGDLNKFDLFLQFPKRCCSNVPAAASQPTHHLDRREEREPR